MRVEKLRGSLLLLTLCLFLAACETSNMGLDTDDSAKAPPAPPRDSTPPVINFVSPDADEQEVEVDRKIVIEFDELVDEEAFLNGDIELYSGMNVGSQQQLLEPRLYLPPVFSRRINGVARDPVTGLTIDAEISVVEITPTSGRFSLDTSYTFKVFLPNEEWFNKTPEERAEEDRLSQELITDDSGLAGEQQALDLRSSRYQERSYSFTVESGEWEGARAIAPVTDSEALFGDIYDVVAASNTNGELVAAWRQNVAGVAQAFISRYLPDEDQWTLAASRSPSEVNATQLSTITDTNVHGVRMAVSSEGRIAVVWYQAIEPGQIDSAWVRVFDGTTWSTPMRLGSAVVAGSHPGLTFDSAGNLFVVWRQMHDGYYRIFSDTYAFQDQPGLGFVIGWNGVAQLSGAQSGHAYSPVLRAGDGGRVVAFWTHAVDQGYRRLFSRAFAAGSWMTAQRVDTSNTGSVGNFSAMLGVNNEGMIAWEQLDGVRSDIWTRRIAGVSLGGAELREHDNTGDALDPGVVMSSTGEVMLVWRQSVSGVSRVLMASYQGSTGWSSSSELAGSGVDHVAMMFDREGHATILSKSGSSSLSAVRKIKNSGWGSAVTLQNGSISSNPVLVPIYEDGRVLVVWVLYQNGQYHLMMSRYVEKSR